MTYVTYHRKTAVIHTLICLIFLIVGVVLSWTVLMEEHSIFEIFYYSTAAILCFWFVGPLFYWNFRRSLGSTILFSYDHESIKLANNQEVPWNSITKIENKAPGMNKFVLPVPSYFKLDLRNNTQVRVYTYNLLKSKEEQTLKEIRSVWNQNKNKK
ncbi:hypothetical protein M3231_19870 [Neobacillus mesonae]|nr:hypothetical protein [Neobacillus mesonae]